MVTNVTGWNQLVSMNMGQAVWVALDSSNSIWNGYLGLVIFSILSIAVFMKTGKVIPTFIFGTSMYALFKGIEVVAGSSVFGFGVESIIVGILLLELAGTITALIKGGY